eukprot:GFUD01061984.1.p1 GENE.GFUD01061984.1~~GFUD01061984.1.p1  ORF type:complete len:167 (-),score=7.28 GFUD01061984.1:27-527(-)
MIPKCILVCLLLRLGASSGQATEKPCCQSKTVGEILYFLVSESDVPSECSSKCIYLAANSTAPRVCFGPGNLAVTCGMTAAVAEFAPCEPNTLEGYWYAGLDGRNIITGTDDGTVNECADMCRRMVPGCQGVSYHPTKFYCYFYNPATAPIGGLNPWDGWCHFTVS